MLKSKNPKLFNEVQQHINPLTSKIDQDIHDIPMGKVMKLQQNGHLVLSDEVSNTLYTLLNQDMDKNKVDEL